MRKIRVLATVSIVASLLFTCKKEKKNYDDYESQAVVEEYYNDSLNTATDDSSSDDLNNAITDDVNSNTSSANFDDGYEANKSVGSSTASESTSYNNDSKSSSTSTSSSSRSSSYKSSSSRSNSSSRRDSNGYVKQNTTSYNNSNKSYSRNSDYSRPSNTYNSNYQKQNTVTSSSSYYNSSNNNSSAMVTTAATAAVAGSLLDKTDFVGVFGGENANLTVNQNKVMYNNLNRNYSFSTDINGQKSFLEALKDMVFGTGKAQFPFNLNTKFIYKNNDNLFSNSPVPFTVRVEEKKYIYQGNYVRELFLYQPDMVSKAGAKVKFQPIRITAFNAAQLLHNLNYKVTTPIPLKPQNQEGYQEIPSDYLEKIKAKYMKVRENAERMKREKAAAESMNQ